MSHMQKEKYVQEDTEKYSFLKSISRRPFSNSARTIIFIAVNAVEALFIEKVILFTWPLLKRNISSFLVKFQFLSKDWKNISSCISTYVKNPSTDINNFLYQCKSPIFHIGWLKACKFFGEMFINGLIASFSVIVIISALTGIYFLIQRVITFIVDVGK